MYVLRYHFCTIETHNRNIFTTYINPHEVLIEVNELANPNLLLKYAHYIHAHNKGNTYSMFIRSQPLFSIDDCDVDYITLYAYNRDLFFTFQRNYIDTLTQEQKNSTTYDNIQALAYEHAVDYLTKFIDIYNNEIKIIIYFPEGHEYITNTFIPANNMKLVQDGNYNPFNDKDYCVIQEYDHQLQKYDHIRETIEEIAEVFKNTKYELNEEQTYTPDICYVLETKFEEIKELGTL